MNVPSSNRFLVVLSLVITAAVNGVQATECGDDGFRVCLGSVDMVPELGLHAVVEDCGLPFVIQFEHLPEAAERSSIKDAGVDLLQYVGGRSYVARCPTGCAEAVASLPVRSTFDLSPAMKRSTAFETDAGLRAAIGSSSAVEVVVRFFPWVPENQALLALDESGATTAATGLRYGNSVIATADSKALVVLLERHEVAWIDPALPITGPALVHAAERSRVDQVRWAAEFLGVDGSGINVGTLDWFPADIHTDLSGRVTDAGVRWGESDHGTAVSGCVAGAGTLEPRATGMAPGASLVWTSWYPDPWTSMEQFHDDYGVTIVNNSWNTKPGWWLSTRSWHGDLWAFGYYHERAATADALVRDTDLLVLFSVGNKRHISFLGPHHHGNQTGSNDGLWHEDLHPPNPEYPSVAGAAVAKNVLTVGGTTKDDLDDLFTSLGPTDDGRIKPDLVAVAVDVLTTAADDGYMVASGTSLSSPVVAGVAALLTDFSRRKHGVEPSSTVLKNLLIHSARDLGEPGPDYLSGFGMADAELAARVLDAAVFDDAEFFAPRRPSGRMTPATAGGKVDTDVNAAAPPFDGVRSLIIEEPIEHGQNSTHYLPVPTCCDELRATLVWHDPPGPQLINNLDLRLEAPDGRVHRPFVLDPEHPAAAAFRDVNHRDNIEQIRINAPEYGQWRIVIEGTSVPDGPQELALIVSAGEGNRPPERLYEGGLVIDEFFATGEAPSGQTPSPWSVFHDGDPLNFYVEAAVLDNADYGDLFGSTTIIISVSDAEGETVVRFNGSGHGQGPGPIEVLLPLGYEIPAEMPPGPYTAHLELAMHNGARRTMDFQFTVASPG